MRAERVSKPSAERELFRAIALISSDRHVPKAALTLGPNALRPWPANITVSFSAAVRLGAAGSKDIAASC
jgi:hypothetical protein